MSSGLRCINCDSFWSKEGFAVSRIYNGSSLCEDCFKFIKEHDRLVRNRKKEDRRELVEKYQKEKER